MEVLDVFPAGAASGFWQKSDITWDFEGSLC